MIDLWSEKRMAKVIMTCGKICSGKSTYAKRLRIKNHAVILSVDEITLALFDQNIGDSHDMYVEKLEAYLLNKSIEIIETGIHVILDWGFWTKAERTYAREFYQSRNIDCEIHFIDISDEIWQERLQKRNNLIAAGKIHAYYVDAQLRKKAASIFEFPTHDEIDVWVRD